MSNQTVGVTGSGGFVGSHLVRRLRSLDGVDVRECPREAWADDSALADWVAGCDAVVHLAGMNRGEDGEIERVNRGLIDLLLDAASAAGDPPRVVFASSTQSERDNPYGRSKAYGERRVAEWAASASGRESASLVIPNVYGPGCKPFYNSVVATFCHQVAVGESPTVVQDSRIEFVWVNQLVEQISKAALGRDLSGGSVRVSGTAELSVTELLAKIEGFRDSDASDVVPDLNDALDASLYATYRYYLPPEAHAIRPTVHADDRGKLFEVIRLAGGGQVFYSTTKPGVVRGNHYHTRKIEWFCVLRGEAAIRMRRVDDDSVHEFRISGEKPEFVSIPVLHTHQIENVGDDELLTMFWCNEIFEAEDPDTFYEQVA
ncbi:MAG: NAD-dependent epimerase/dehydratase family protein [Planctomycetota bacterium]